MDIFRKRKKATNEVLAVGLLKDSCPSFLSNTLKILYLIAVNRNFLYASRGACAMFDKFCLFLNFPIFLPD